MEKGTKYYMSPQQAKSYKYTTKADAYALGVIFFEMLCGLGNVPMDLDCVN
jgi:serine/threonine protein kinase